MRLLPVALLAAVPAALRAALRVAVPAALLAAVLLPGCASASPSAASAAGAPAASAPFYVEAGWVTVSVVDGFTGRTEATIAAPHWAGSFPWVGHTTWYPCGAAPDDRTFLLCGKRQYTELRLGDDGKPQSTSAPRAIPAVARNNGSNGDPVFAVSPDARLAAVVTPAGLMTVSLTTGATRTWTIPSADGSATSLSWAGDRYVAFQFVSQPRDRAAAGVRVLDTRSAATAALAASRLVISNDRAQAFNPVITPNGAKIIAAVWTSFQVAELAEFNAQTGHLTAVLIPASSMPGHGSPCQALWTDSPGTHLIAYCGASGIINGTHFTPTHLYLPDTSGIAYTDLLW